MPNRGGEKSKLWCFLKSLFGCRRKGQYDLVGAANRCRDRCYWETEVRNDQHQKRRRCLFSSRKSYDVARMENLADQRTTLSMGSYRKTLCFVQNDQIFESATRESFVAALYREGLLQWPYASQNFSDPLCIPEVFHRPVLSLCYGFQDHELRENCRRLTHRRRSFFEFDPYEDSWVQSGLNQVLIDEFREEEPRVDNIPVSLWMSVIEPALQTLMLYRFGRNKRLNITSKRQQTPINSLHNMNVQGDNIQPDGHIGPPNQQHWALGLVAVFTMRIGELGERQLRHRDTICDVQIPDFNSKTRRRNRNRAKTTRANTIPVVSVTE